MLLKAIELIENLARQRDGLNEGRDWQQYVELCKAAGHLPNMDLQQQPRQHEPIGIGPGGYDPMKDTDVTGV